MDQMAAATTRRRFIDWFLGTAFGALILSVIYPLVRYVSPPHIPEASLQQVEAGETTEPVFREKGFKIIRFGADPVIVVRAAENDFRAFSATCTHLDCIVGYQKDHSRLLCNCHGGTFDLSGRNLAGPPPRPLTAFKVNLAPRSNGTTVLIVSKV
ncbi:MAG TPA: ubiquinol-cytochrome c reductase iron-sulfur subunit [Thermoanaerobaculia bacterium]|nr:ubiquinol-cytochrome c reductase iron-sulfur subunit [Thermoanaerobaculia bacterium]